MLIGPLIQLYSCLLFLHSACTMVASHHKAHHPRHTSTLPGEILLRHFITVPRINITRRNPNAPHVPL